MPVAPSERTDQHAMLRLLALDQERLEHLAKTIGRKLEHGDTLLLHGNLGAGKTTFARALIQARLAELGQWEDVPSPSFTLVQQYDLGTCEIWHVDLYRLAGPQDAVELGLEDAFEDAICLIEWPDRLGDLVPEAALNVRLSPNDDDSRDVTLWSAPSGRAAKIVKDLAPELQLDTD